MRSSFVRLSLITVIVGSVFFGPGIKSYSEGTREVIDVLSFHWGITQTDFARVCIANPNQSRGQGDDILLRSVISFDVQARERIERELRIPVGEVRCTDVTPEQLVTAGAVPESTGRVNFVLTLSAFNDVNSRAISAGQNLPIGSIETIKRATGQTRIYQGIHWRFDPS